MSSTEAHFVALLALGSVACAQSLSVFSDQRLLSRVIDATKIEAGCTVTAPALEYSHFLRRATVFVIEHDASASMGVNLLKPTLLTIGEAAQGVSNPEGCQAQDWLPTGR